MIDEKEMKEYEELEELEEQEFLIEDTIEPFEKTKNLKRKFYVSLVLSILTILTVFFPKYRDFDVIFKALYNTRYETYNLSENLGSAIFIAGFIISLLFTIFIGVLLLTNDDLREHPRVKKYYEVFDIVSIVPIFIAIVTLSNTFLVSPASVTRGSMMPNYYEGDDVFVLHSSNYNRFDVVIVLAEESSYNPLTDMYTSNQYYIKRLIGLPGETITIKDGFIYIDGMMLDDPTTLMVGAGTYCDIQTNSPIEECTWTLGEDEYFLIGDNREASLDSRRLGPFKKEDLYGKVILKIG